MGRAGEELLVKSGKCQSLVLGIGSCEKQEPFCLVLASEKKHSEGKEERMCLKEAMAGCWSRTRCIFFLAACLYSIFRPCFGTYCICLELSLLGSKSLSVRNFLGGGCWALLIFVNNFFSKITNVCIGNEQ